MEPKNPIVIDGVDVSGCGYCLKMTKCRCAIQQDVYKCLCEENPNCLFKQLARKEHECQRTEQKLTLIRDFITDTQIYNMAQSICDKILKIIDEVNTDGRK